MTARTAPPLARRLGLVAWVGAAALLALPALAMRFTDEVQWTGFDFAAFAGMLALLVAPFQLALRRVRNLAALAGTAVALGTGFLEVWVNLAVGIVGDGANQVNLVFMALVALALVAALVVRGSPRAMARILLAAALVQAAILVVLAVTIPERGVYLTGVFVAGWLLSAWLYRRSAVMPDWHSAAH